MAVDETGIRERLRKIEALFAAAGTEGERQAAGAALDRLRARLAETQHREAAVELRISLPDRWSRQLFMALCRRYGLRPYRYHRQRHTTLMLRVPQQFFDTVLWPEFHEINQTLHEYLNAVTDRVIRDEVFADISEAPEVDEAHHPAGRHAP
jgi:hypothetical protein